MTSNMDDSPQESQGEEARPVRGTINVSKSSTTQFAGLLQADSVEISGGGALAVLASEARLEKGFSLITAARDLSVEKAGSQWLLAGDAHLDQSGAGIVIARHVEASDARVAVLIAGRVDGNVQTLLDTDSAIRFGAAFGAVLGFALLLRRILTGR